MNGLCGTTASHLDATNSHRWSLKCANLGTSQATKQIIVCGRQGLRSYMKHKFQKKIIQERTGHRSLECLRMYEHTSDKQQQAVSNILSSHSQSSYAEMTKLEHKNTPTTSTFGPRFGPNMKFDSCQVNININHDHLLQSTSPAAVHSVQ